MIRRKSIVSRSAKFVSVVEGWAVFRCDGGCFAVSVDGNSYLDPQGRPTEELSLFGSVAEVETLLAKIKLMESAK